MNCGQVVSRMCLITFSMELCDLFNRDLHVSVLVLVKLGFGGAAARMGQVCSGGGSALSLPPSLA